MALSIDGTGNGSLNNLALSANTGTIVDTARAGGIVQVVQGTTSTEVSVSTTTYTDTTLTASITPSSSSNKILIYVMQEFVALRSQDGVGMGLRVLRDSTVVWGSIQNGTGPYHWYTDDQELDGHAVINYLDSPSTTSSVTYKTQGRPYTTNNGGYVNFQNDTGVIVDPVSTIILMEVVA